MQITPKSYTLRFNAAESEEVNRFLEENNVDTGNFKELFFSILQKAITPVTDVIECLPAELVAVAKDTFNIADTEEATDGFITAQIIDALQHPITVEVERVVEKVVENSIPDNHHLIELSDKQLTTLKEIADNRAANAKKYRITHELEQPIPLLKKMAFNRATLHNWHGEFYTGK